MTSKTVPKSQTRDLSEPYFASDNFFSASRNSLSKKWLRWSRNDQEPYLNAKGIVSLQSSDYFSLRIQKFASKVQIYQGTRKFKIALRENWEQINCK